jgi:hypothetical protein
MTVKERYDMVIDKRKELEDLQKQFSVKSGIDGVVGFQVYIASLAEFKKLANDLETKKIEVCILDWEDTEYTHELYFSYRDTRFSHFAKGGNFGMVECYVGINSEHGEVVPVSEGFEYAMDRIHESKTDMELFKAEFGEQVVEWFFSGDFVKERLCDET